MTRKTQQYHHGDLREALLKTAVDLITEEGLENLTLRALGSRLDVSRSAPYRHFADKAALIAGVRQQGFIELHDQLMEVDTYGFSDQLARFKEQGRIYIRFAIDHKVYYRLMFEGGATDPNVYPQLAKAEDAVFAVLVGAIQKCQADHHIRSGDPGPIAYHVWATIHGLSSLLLDGQIRSVVNEADLIETTVEALIHGIRP